MAKEWIYTSTPRGLEGKEGFGTVAATQGMSPQMFNSLEGFIAYKPESQPNAAPNPPSIFYYSYSDGRSRYGLFARVSACEQDYTRRTNKIAHVILVSDEEKARLSSGPSVLLRAPQLFRTEWKGEPQWLTERVLDYPAIATAPANAWKQATGDAGWAAWLAERYLADPAKPCFILFDPHRHQNIHELVAETLMLLPVNKRWEVTWNTCLTEPLPPRTSCNWRFCVSDDATLRRIGYNPNNAYVLDLVKNLEPAGDSQLSQCARSGRDPYPAAPSYPATQGNGGLSYAVLKKKGEEEEEMPRSATINRDQLRLKNRGNNSSANNSAHSSQSSYAIGNDPSFTALMASSETRHKTLVYLMGGALFLQLIALVLMALIYMQSRDQQKQLNEMKEIKETQVTVSKSISKLDEQLKEQLKQLKGIKKEIDAISKNPVLNPPPPPNDESEMYNGNNLDETDSDKSKKRIEIKKLNTK